MDQIAALGFDKIVAAIVALSMFMLSLAALVWTVRRAGKTDVADADRRNAEAYERLARDVQATLVSVRDELRRNREETDARHEDNLGVQNEMNAQRVRAWEALDAHVMANFQELRTMLSAVTNMVASKWQR